MHPGACALSLRFQLIFAEQFFNGAGREMPEVTRHIVCCPPLFVEFRIIRMAVGERNDEGAAGSKDIVNLFQALIQLLQMLQHMPECDYAA